MAVIGEILPRRGSQGSFRNVICTILMELPSMLNMKAENKRIKRRIKTLSIIKNKITVNSELRSQKHVDISTDLFLT